MFAPEPDDRKAATSNGLGLLVVVCCLPETVVSCSGEVQEIPSQLVVELRAY